MVTVTSVTNDSPQRVDKTMNCVWSSPVVHNCLTNGMTSGLHTRSTVHLSDAWSFHALAQCKCIRPAHSAYKILTRLILVDAREEVACRLGPDDRVTHPCVQSIEIVVICTPCCDEEQCIYRVSKTVHTHPPTVRNVCPERFTRAPTVHIVCPERFTHPPIVRIVCPERSTCPPTGTPCLVGVEAVGLVAIGYLPYMQTRDVNSG